MDTPSSALLLHSSIDKDPRISPQGSSGISISENWILMHGTAFSRIIDKSHAISSFITSLVSGELTIAPKELANELKFRVYRDVKIDSSRSGDYSHVQENLGSVVAAWKCPLLTKTFDDFFDTWSFPKSSVKFDRSLRSIYLLVFINSNGKSIVEIPTVKQALSRLLDQTLRKPTRGLSVEIESTPFGNPVFIGSIAHGVISNVVGNEGCVIMTDAYAFPGSEGGPVYVIPLNCKRRIISGLVIAPLSWCRGEWVDYTFAANLAPCLLNILRKKDLRCLPITNRQEDEREAFDRGVVLIRCGINWGTGILIDKDTGTFLTCSHVVTEAPEREISIIMSTDQTNSRAWAKLLYRTPENQPYDVAVLRMNPQDIDPSLKSIRLSRAPVVKGEPVVSVGFPFSSSVRPTISSGVISKSMDCALLTTCCAQSGTSGGPIVSRATGEMLGMIVCNALSSDGAVLYPRMSLAVPAAVLDRPLREYLRTDNLEVLRALTCDDAIVRNIWNFYPLLPSKL